MDFLSSLVMTKQPDLFDLPPTWKEDPLKGFDAFVRGVEFVEMGKHGKARKAEGREVRPISKESATVYTHMFTNYVRWLENKRIRFEQAGEQEIRAFLDTRHDSKDSEGKKLNSAIRARYLRLLERVYAHLHVMPNPATQASYGEYRGAKGGRDQPKAYLTEKQQLAFLAHLPEAPPFDPFLNEDGWERRRDRAMLAMMLGAGLKVSEVLYLRVDQIGKRDANGDVPVRFPTFAKGTHKEHDTVLRTFAARYVLPWIEERKQRKLPTKLLFPATLTTDAPLHKATVYRHVKATLQRAGLEVPRMGGRTLRNSFAVRELGQGASIEQVKSFLGLYEQRSAEKYVVNKPHRRLID